MDDTIVIIVRRSQGKIVAQVVEMGVVQHRYEVLGIPSKQLFFYLGEKVSDDEGKTLSFAKTIYNGYKTKARKIFAGICSCGSEQYRDVIKLVSFPEEALDQDELEFFQYGLQTNFRG